MMNKGGAMKQNMSVIAVILFVGFLMLSFTTLFLEKTNPSSDILQDARYNESINSVQGSIDGLNSQSDNIANTFKSDNPSKIAFVFLIIQSAFDIPKLLFMLFWNDLKVIGSILFPFSELLSNIFALGITLSMTIISIRFVLDAIKSVRTGDSG